MPVLCVLCVLMSVALTQQLRVRREIERAIAEPCRHGQPDGLGTRRALDATLEAERRLTKREKSHLALGRSGGNPTGT